jgi:hypothetical protein
MKKLYRILGVALVILLTAGGVWWFLHHRGPGPSELAVVHGKKTFAVQRLQLAEPIKKTSVDSTEVTGQPVGVILRGCGLGPADVTSLAFRSANGDSVIMSSSEIPNLFVIADGPESFRLAIQADNGIQPVLDRLTRIIVN